MDNIIYTKYNLINGYVEETSENDILITEGYAVAKSKDIKLGQEFEFYITIGKVKEDGFISEVSMTKQAPSITKILEENKKNKDLSIALGAELTNEKLKNIEKTNVTNNLGQELAKLKLQIIQLQGGSK